jgi:hypothetical protein
MHSSNIAGSQSEAGKKYQWTATSTDVTGRPARHRRSHHAIKASAMSVLPGSTRSSGVNKSAKMVLG